MTIQKELMELSCRPKAHSPDKRYIRIAEATRPCQMLFSRVSIQSCKIKKSNALRPLIVIELQTEPDKEVFIISCFWSDLRISPNAQFLNSKSSTNP